MEQKHFEQLDERVFQTRLDNGLTVCVVPKPEFNKTFATFTTNYGSIDNRFIPLNKNDWITVPDGIAHFLEHKMFEKPGGGDVFQDFSSQGAQTNAFTSFTRTAYLFSSTSNVEVNLQTLLDMVQTPGFTDQTVEKEKGIIGQEIQMYNDNADWRVYFGLIENMYEKHPVKVDIAGTIESISKITTETLMECYQTFYHPSNMMFFVVGPVDPERVIQVIEENQKAKDYTDKQPVERDYPTEKGHVAKPKSVLKMAVNTSKLMVGYKEGRLHRNGKEMQRHELSVSLLLELMFGKGTDRYQALINEDLIDDSFSFDYTEEKEFGFSAMGGNTKDPDRLAKRLFDMVEEFKGESIDATAFERARKKKIGSLLKSLNSPEYIANQFTRYWFNDMNLFDTVPILEALTIENLEQVMNEHFVREAFTSCQVVPK
ncbi:pitrilysin family protein [Pullulanibacillus sp. KACC 23026]|uniref:EF-P 5-aminopentanol modification-associated protein YfmH n=1 Tax=Pullulanibacillus sp. KACC 23026 TaxID=3028315 RepID=UPI0023B00589|nr:pitrilysin family protein [Pullulanibacillus sp. KACC 23026]WEG11559.1 pitrilysin family protein [Pullulanibacillus sp. KACC 23026]